MTEKKIPEATAQQLHEQVKLFRELPGNGNLEEKGSKIVDLSIMLEPYADSRYGKELDEISESESKCAHVTQIDSRFIAIIDLMHRLGVW